MCEKRDKNSSIRFTIHFHSLSIDHIIYLVNLVMFKLKYIEARKLYSSIHPYENIPFSQKIKISCRQHIFNRFDQGHHSNI